MGPWRLWLRHCQYYSRHCWRTRPSSGGFHLHLTHVSRRLPGFVFWLNMSASVGRVVGTGVFSTPSTILGSVGSVGASLMLWVLGFILSFCGLFIWLELGTMFPRSGGEKVYLEAAYQRPRHLATVFFAANAIIWGFMASNCIVTAAIASPFGLHAHHLFARYSQISVFNYNFIRCLPFTHLS